MLSAAADKLETETAIGTLEHFFVELAELKRVRTLDRKLFSALFSKTVSSWRQYFDEIEYDIDQARPMQRSALQALKDLQTK
jgi:hypothetical protein